MPHRNALLFNVCFLFAAGTPDEVTDNYDIAIKQLNRYIRQTEEEHSFLSKQETKSTLPRYIPLCFLPF